MEVKVGYLGPDTPNGPDTTTFGYMAAKKYFPGKNDGVELTNFPSHEKICIAVAKQEITSGIVAVENSVHGFVAETIRAVSDAEMYGGLRVCGEVVVPIELYYLRKQTDDSLPKAVISHSVALSQCDNFLQKLKSQGIDSEVRRSTAEAAYEASQNPDYAAIASARAEQAYGLRRLVPGSIVDDKSAMTRFWVLGKQHAEKTGRDKTAILVALRQDEAGSLWKTLGSFVATKTDDGSYRLNDDELRPNLLYIYPLPISGRHWEYNFLLEFNGHNDDPVIHNGLERFIKSGVSLMHARFLGSYPSVTV